jgi:GTPase
MKCGYVALIGRPNVGKSTLMNHLLGQKISITSRKPQTTRHRILGINTSERGQIIYLDTPGMHEGGKQALNRYLNRSAETALSGVDVVIWLIDGIKWQPFDDIIQKKIEHVGVPVILAVNKADRIKDKAAALAFFDEAQQRFSFAEIIPISALKKTNLDQLENSILNQLSEAEPIFPEDQITDRPERFLCAEIIREKLTRRLGAELPYSLTVEIERYQELPQLTKIYAIIWVERLSQKSIVIGAEGEMLKSVGSDARKDIEKLLDQKVYIQLWVKVKRGWSDNERALQSLGFND